MKIIFDFDHTLFDTKRFFLFFEKKFVEKFNLKKEIFEKSFKKSKNNFYKPQKHFLLLSKKIKVFSKKDFEKELFSLLKKYSKKFLYPEVLEVLNKLKKDFSLYLISFGEKNFQMEKIKGSGIGKYFKKIIITSKRDKTPIIKKILQRDKKAVFVDDDQETIKKVKENFPEIFVIMIDREKKKKDKGLADLLITNLKELPYGDFKKGF